MLSATDTPSLRRVLDAKGGSYGALADPGDVAEQALDHLADGPTWIWGDNPAGGSRAFPVVLAVPNRLGCHDRPRPAPGRSIEP